MKLKYIEIVSKTYIMQFYIVYETLRIEKNVTVNRNWNMPQ